MLWVAINVPCKNTAVKPRSHQESLTPDILNVLNPIGVAPQHPHFLLQISYIPQGNCGVI